MLEIQRYGAKGAVLKYIQEADPSIPILPFFNLAVGTSWRDHEDKITSLGDKLMVRSSSPQEDCPKVSFAGIFSTQYCYNNSTSTIDWNVNSVIRSLQNKNAQRYAQIHKVQEPLTMGLLFQKYHPGSKWSMLRHPHQEKVIFLSHLLGEECKGLDYVYREDTKEVHTLDNFQRKEELTNLSSDLPLALETYARIEKLPEFQTSYTYQMEFGTLPFSVFQFRPFRKKETASWKCVPDKPRMENYSFPFGITPEEGIELKVVRAIQQIQEYQRFKNIMEQNRSKDKIKTIIRFLGLNPEERIYAERLVQGYNPEEYSPTLQLDQILQELNEIYSEENTAVTTGNLHYNPKGIDIDFPNAKAWIPSKDGNHGFLAHGTFRAIQHYDISLMGYGCKKRTGGRIRIFSDGINARIEPG